MKKIITICVLALLIVPVLTVTATENEVLESEIQTILTARGPTPKSLTMKNEGEVPTLVNTGQAPNTPVIAGPTSITIGERYEYTIAATDPQEDDVYYKISWGDGSIIYWDGPHKSSEEVTFEHAWCEVCYPMGEKFTICVQVKDVNGNMGDCGTFEVSIDGDNHQSSIGLSFLQFLENLLERFPLLEHLLGF